MTDSQSGVQTTDAQVNSQKLTNTKDIIAYLAEKFPLCFILEGEAKPLKNWFVPRFSGSIRR